MRFLIDENVHKEIVSFLKDGGYDVATVPSGMENGKIVQLARKEKRILLTHDLHFANIMLYPPKEYSGIIRIKIHPPSLPKVIKALKSLLPKISSKGIDKKLIVLEKDGFFRIKE